jgi:putative membrane protein
MTVVAAHWPASPLAVAAYVVVAAAHLLGLRADGLGRRRGAVREAVLFQLGLLLALAALISPLAYWSHRLVWVRSLQDLLLAVAAPGLIVLGAPWLALRRAALGVPWLALRRAAWWRAATRHGGARGPGRPAGAGTPGRAARPVAVAVAFNAAWCAWHLPALYDAAAVHPAVLALEAASYLGLGVLFWRELIGSWPHRARLSPLGRLALLVPTVAVGSVLGMVGVFSSGVLYPAYLGGAHHTFSLVADQQVGGAVLWLLILPAYSVTAVALTLAWLNEEEPRAMTAGLDRLLKPARPAWPSRPGLR